MSSRTALVLVVVVVLLAVGALFIWPLIRDRQGPAAVLPPAPDAVSDWYDIAFTTPIYPDRPENRRGGIDERLTTLINGAQRSLDVAIYDFDLRNVAGAMAGAKSRGVAVRMVTDTETLANRDPAIIAAFEVVRNAGIVIVDDKRSAIMHHKFVVIDGATVLTGSWNFTTGDTYRLNNNVVVFRSAELAANFSTEFEKMHTARRFGPTKPKDKPHPIVTFGTAQVETYFAAEEDPSDRIVAAIRGAQTSIDFLAFSFTHDAIGQAMIERAKAGVKVRGVFEKTGSETRFSEYGAMKAAGLDVHQDGSPYAMHHKVIVIDGRHTIFGSFNFSDSAANDNDENLLIVDEPAFARAFLAEVDRMVNLAKSPTLRR